MILMLVLVHLVLPLALICWLALMPLRGSVALAVQVLATGLAILALAWSGMWILPPWWTPYLFGLLWIMAAVFALSRSRWLTTMLPMRLWDWTGAALLLLLGGYAAIVAVDAYSGRTPTTEVIKLTSPSAVGPISSPAEARLK